MAAKTSWYIRMLSERRKQRLANFFTDIRHQLYEYPHEELARTRDRVIDDAPTESPIPRVIAQTYRTSSVVRPFFTAVTAWQEMNPEFDYRFFDDEAARAFIEERYPKDVLEAYDALIPGAYRADLWRYCYLAAEGGVYVDIRMEPLVALRTMLAPGPEGPPSFVVARDRMGRIRSRTGYLYNAFIACTPGHPFVVAALERTVKIVHERGYGRDDLDISGPACLGAATNLILNRPIDAHFELGDHTDPAVGCYRILCHEDDDFHRNVLTFGNRLFIRTKCIHGHMIRADRGFPQKAYSVLWDERNVYR